MKKIILSMMTSVIIFAVSSSFAMENESKKHQPGDLISTQKVVSYNDKLQDEALKTFEPELIKDLMNNVENSAVTTRTVAFFLGLGGMHQLKAATNFGTATNYLRNPKVPLKHAFNAGSFFLATIFLYKSYRTQYSLYETLKGCREQSYREHIIADIGASLNSE